MAEINAKDLTAKTTPASTDSMLLFGTTSNEGGKITVDNMKDWVLSGLSTKTFPNQVGGSSAATILAQLSTLNSNFTGENINCTADSGFTVIAQSGAIIGNLVYGYLDIKGVIPATTWTDVGTLQSAAKPKTYIHVNVISRSTGAHVGMGRININGKISFFVTTDINNSDVAISFAYNKEQAI